MDNFIASIGYVQVIGGALCAFLGFIVACIIAYPLIKKKVLEEQIKQADQRAEGWKELAEQREATIRQRGATIEEFKAKIAQVEATFTKQIEELKQQIGEVTRAHSQMAEENQFVKDENIVLQRTNRTLSDEKRCISEERDGLRAENIRMNQQLVDTMLHMKSLDGQVKDLLERLHSQGEETRE